MKFNRYKNILSADIAGLENEVNTLISKGCKPLGGISITVADRNIVYAQTVVVEDESNNSLGEFSSEPYYLSEVRRLVLNGEKLAAVKHLKANSEMGLKEAKYWVDTHC